LARRYLADHPLALLVDIDGLRTQLGQWDRWEESRTVARELALALAEAQLSSGRDVIVPQYLGRIEFIERLDDLARRCGAEFVEVVLVTELTVSIERFRRRRAELEPAGTPHPEADVAEAEIEQIVRDAFDRLSAICDRRPAVQRVPAGADLETTYLALLASISDPVS
jgi:predicted kinase